jgi:hypothetical protein
MDEEVPDDKVKAIFETVFELREAYRECPRMRA